MSTCCPAVHGGRACPAVVTCFCARRRSQSINIKKQSNILIVLMFLTQQHNMVKHPAVQGSNHLPCNLLAMQPPGHAADSGVPQDVATHAAQPHHTNAESARQQAVQHAQQTACAIAHLHIALQVLLVRGHVEAAVSAQRCQDALGRRQAQAAALVATGGVAAQCGAQSGAPGSAAATCILHGTSTA